MSDETGKLLPGDSISDWGEAIRDLAYEKLADECIRLYQRPGDSAKQGEITVSSNGEITIDAHDQTIIIEFDPDHSSNGIESVDDIYSLSPIQDSGIFDYIPGKLKRYKADGIDACESIIQSISAAVDRSTRDVDTQRSNISSATEDWTGKSADSFNTFFLNPFEEAIVNQKAILLEIQAGVTSQQSIIEHAEKSIKKIAEDTYDQLYEYPVNTAWEIAMPIIGAALAIGSLGVGASLEISIVLGLTSLLKTVGEAGVSVSDSLVAGDSSSVISIIDSMNDAIAQLDEDIANESERLSGALRQSTAEIDRFLQGGPEQVRYLLPHRPSIADDTPSIDDFGAPG